MECIGVCQTLRSLDANEPTCCVVLGHPRPTSQVDRRGMYDGRSGEQGDRESGLAA